MIKICLEILVLLGLKLLQNQRHGKRCLCNVMVQLLFRLFEGQELFFLKQRKLLNDSDVLLKVVRRAGVMQLMKYPRLPQQK